MGYYSTFVVKIWCDNCGRMVRGRVQHVRSQETVHFLEMSGMTDFMAGHLPLPVGEPASIEGSGNSLPDFGASGEGRQDE